MRGAVVIDISHNPVVYIVVSVLIPVMAILLPFWLRQRKRVAFGVLYRIPIIQVNLGHSLDVEIRYRNTVVEDLEICMVKVWNAGNQEIRREDYEEPIRLNFVGATVIHAEILRTTPRDVTTTLTYEGGKVQLAPVLLNQDSIITVKAVVTGRLKDVKLETYIAGAKVREADASELQSPADRRNITRVVLITTVCFVLIPFLIAIADRQIFQECTRNVIENTIASLVLVGMGSIAICWQIAQKRTSSNFRLWDIRSWTPTWVAGILIVSAILTLTLIRYIDSILPLAAIAQCKL